MKIFLPKLILLCLILTLLVGCGLERKPSSAGESPSHPPNTVVRKSEPEAEKTLQQFAELVTAGDARGAANLLAPGLKGVYEFQDYAPIRNTPRMDIMEMRDLSSEWRPDTSGMDQADVVEARVYYLKVRYKVRGLIPSDFVDGEVFHHKATVVNLKDGRWLISELSTTRPPS